MGVFFAFLAWASWGVGDFLISRSTKTFGSWLTLFYITAGAAISLFPWVLHDFSFLLQPAQLGILLLASLIMLAAALGNFQALKIGKISAMEPIFAFEVLIVLLFSSLFLQEPISGLQFALIILLMLGVFLVATESFQKFRSLRLEPGVWYAIGGTICMGLSNFLFGVGARSTSPLMINWFTSLCVAIVCFLYLISQRKLPQIKHYWMKHKLLVTSVIIIDNGAWIAYSYSTLFIPIAIATGITESYIALAAGLGILVNKEQLRNHHWVGLVLAIVAAVILATTTHEV